MNKHYLGHILDDFLEEEGLLAKAEVDAIKSVIAFQISRLMSAQSLSKPEIARRIQISHAAEE